MVNAAALAQTKGLYFMGKNPAMSDPDADHVSESLCGSTTCPGHFPH